MGVSTGPFYVQGTARNPEGVTTTTNVTLRGADLGLSAVPITCVSVKVCSPGVRAGKGAMQITFGPLAPPELQVTLTTALLVAELST